MPGCCTRSGSPFPPNTRELQCDEKWSFVYKKQKHCDPTDPADHCKGDCWDHLLFDPEHKLVLEVIVGHRNNSAALELLQIAKTKVRKLPPAPRRKRRQRRRVGASTLRRRKRTLLLATDGYPAYPRAVQLVFGSPPPPGLGYAIVQKQKDEQGHVIAVDRKCVCGTQRSIERTLSNSPVSSTINTAFIERHNATDRHRNARKIRRTYRFSKDWQMHQAVTYLIEYTYNFCCPVQTLRQKRSDGTFRPRTPAMSAKLTDHIWSLDEWLHKTVTGLPN